MAISIYPITENFAAEVGVDLAQLSAENVASIKDAFWRYGVLIFPGQNLDQEQHLAFAEHLGPLEPTISAYAKLGCARTSSMSRTSTPATRFGARTARRAASVSVIACGIPIAHSNICRRAPRCSTRTPSRRSEVTPNSPTCAPRMMRCPRTCGGGSRASSPSTRSRIRARARTGFTNFSESERKELPPVPQVMVRTILENGRRTLYLASHIGRIFGMSDDECRALVDRLIAHATQRQFVYTHRWRLHDLVMWDDRCTMHRGTEFDDLRYRRDMQRATVSDIANSCEQEGVAIPQS